MRARRICNPEPTPSSDQAVAFVLHNRAVVCPCIMCSFSKFGAWAATESGAKELVTLTCLIAATTVPDLAGGQVAAAASNEGQSQARLAGRRSCSYGVRHEDNISLNTKRRINCLWQKVAIQRFCAVLIISHHQSVCFCQLRAPGNREKQPAPLQGRQPVHRQAAPQCAHTPLSPVYARHASGSGGHASSTKY